MNDDFAAAPWGRVGPVPMVLSRHLGDNQALLTNTSMAWGVELGENVVTAVSDDYAFGDHQVTIKRRRGRRRLARHALRQYPHHRHEQLAAPVAVTKGPQEAK